MNNYNPPQEIEIDLIDLMWKLLMQWKAILIVCIIMALLVPGVKYAKDSKAYKAALAEKKAAEEQASKPEEEQIEAALESLPAKDREDVMFIVQQQELADLQKDYLENSIYLNTNPASQRQLSVKYLLKTDGGTDIGTLADAYSTCLRRKDTIKALRDVIAPDSNIEYIYELIETTGIISSLFDDSDSAIYTVTIVLPDDSDADKVIEVIEASLNDNHSEIESSVGPHSVQRKNIEDYHIYNETVISRRANATYTINNLNSSIDNAKNKLSSEQQAAYEAIIAVKHAAGDLDDKAKAAADDADQADDDLQAPSFSKKYALLGFILGAFLYAGIYVVMLILKKIVGSASTAQSYTGTRLLGEVYKMAEHKGLSALFASAAVAKWRYKDKLDADRQTDALASTVDAVCAHHGTDKLTLLLSGIETEFDDTIRMIAEKCRNIGNKKSIDILNADDMDEKLLDSVDNAVYVLSSNSKVDKLGSLISLCRDYDVTPLGSVYLEEL